MASLLSRLAHFATRRAWAVIVAWVVILGIAIGAFMSMSAPLTNSFDIPGTASGAVTDQLAQKLPDTAGGTGTVVFRTDDGSALTTEQQERISELTASAADLDGVAAVVDPFDAQQSVADQAQKLADGRAQLASGKEQLESGQEQLDAGRAQLVDGAAAAHGGARAGDLRRGPGRADRGDRCPAGGARCAERVPARAAGDP